MGRKDKPLPALGSISVRTYIVSILCTIVLIAMPRWERPVRVNLSPGDQLVSLRNSAMLRTY